MRHRNAGFCRRLANIEENALGGEYGDGIDQCKKQFFVTLPKGTLHAAFTYCEDDTERERHDGTQKLSGKPVDELLDSLNRLNSIQLVVVNASKREQNCDKGQCQSSTGQQPRKGSK